MTATIDGWLAILGGGVAIAGSYTMLELAARLSTRSRRHPFCRTLGGAVALGVTLWCLNLIALLAMTPPPAPGSHLTLQLDALGAALLLAVLAQTAPLTLLAGQEPAPARLLAGGTAAAAAVAVTYWAAAAAFGNAQPAAALPDAHIVAAAIASAALGVAAFGAALWLRYRPGRRRGQSAIVGRLIAVALVALALLAPHALVGTHLRWSFRTLPASPELGLQFAAVALTVLALAVLAVTHVVTVYDGRLALRTGQCARELEEVHTRLQYLATHDSLTGLPNRLLFRERLAQLLGDTDRPGRALAVAVFDLDRFSALNHSLGHGAGDWLLTEVARRIGAVVQPEDLFARLGSDEFAVLIDSIAPRLDAAAVTRAILDALAQPISINGTDVLVRPSIGISVWPDDGRRGDDLLAHAEVALTAAKARGGHAQFFASGMTDSMQERLALENDLRRALSAGEFELAFQPVISTRSGRIVTAEALVRWRHPVRGIIGPSSFIPLAEETGLMIPLGEWVLREVCRQASAWRTACGLPVRIAVNLSATQFRHQNLLEVIRSALEQARLEASCLEIELTESSVMTNPEESAGVLRQLRRMGIVVAIDDFGTGYSSLSYLRRFPIDKLKIDSSFVRDLPTSKTDESIVRAIISLAHSVGLHVVAEGVETEEQLRCVRTLGCDQWQGYYCCEPQSAALFGEMLGEQSGTRTGLVAVLARAKGELDP
jgi:diguanylate cyclase